jgi:hypothetical protein
VAGRQNVTSLSTASSEEAQFMWISRPPDVWGMDNAVQNLNPVYTPYEFTYNDWEVMYSPMTLTRGTSGELAPDAVDSIHGCKHRHSRPHDELR